MSNFVSIYHERNKNSAFTWLEVTHFCIKSKLYKEDEGEAVQSMTKRDSYHHIHLNVAMLLVHVRSSRHQRVET